MEEGPAFGAALLAGVGCGLYNSVSEASRATVRVVDELPPRPAERLRYQGYYTLYRNLYTQLQATFDQAQALVEAEHLRPG